MIAKILTDKRPIVEVMINTKKAAMLIDTGASINVINEKSLKPYGVTKRMSMGEINGAGGTVEMWHLNNCDVKIEGIPIYQFVSGNFDNVVESIKEETGVTIAGIIGTPAIKSAELIVNLSAGEVSIGYSN